MTDLAFVSAAEPAGMIRSRQVLPAEVMRAMLDRIEASQKGLDAFITVAAETAMAAAESALLQGSLAVWIGWRPGLGNTAVAHEAGSG